MKNKKFNDFKFGIFVLSLAVLISLFAFTSEDKNITGYFVLENHDIINPSKLAQFKSVDLLGSLAPGNYYIDGSGIVYWIDDEPSPAIAIVDNTQENQRGREIYIDNQGRVGYTLGTNEK